MIGLAIGSQLPRGLSTILVETHSKFGQETSSRNSEVIHSGIYYPEKSKKTELCIRGKKILYQFCKEAGIGFGRIGKIVVGNDEKDEEYLTRLVSHVQNLGIPHEELSETQIREKEPLIRGLKGVFFPESGIINSHELMERLERNLKDAGVHLAYRHSVKKIEKEGNSWRVSVESPDETFFILPRVIINAAGLGAAHLSNLALQTNRYEHRFCRGRYLSLAPQFQGKFKHLIYPVPVKDGVGIHITLDTESAVRLGPDVDWCESATEKIYDCDWEFLKDSFLPPVNRYCPSIKREHLSPALIGIRPKLFIDKVAYPDFLVENQDGFIHCLGIESPGLTASLAIAEEVKTLVEETL